MADTLYNKSLIDLIKCKDGTHFLVDTLYNIKKLTKNFHNTEKSVF